MSDTSSSSNIENCSSNIRIAQQVFCDGGLQRSESQVPQGDTLVVWTPQETTAGSLEACNQECELLYLVDTMERDTYSNNRVGGDGTIFYQNTTTPARVAVVPAGNFSRNLLPTQFSNPVQVPKVSNGSICKSLDPTQLSHPMRVPIIPAERSFGSLDPIHLRIPVLVNPQQKVPVSEGSVPLCDVGERGGSVPRAMSLPADSSRFDDRKDPARLDLACTTFESGSSFTIKPIKQLHCDTHLDIPQESFADNFYSVPFKPDVNQEANRASPPPSPKVQLDEQHPKSVNILEEPKQTPHRIIRVCTTNPAIAFGTKSEDLSSLNHSTTTQQDCNPLSYPEAFEITSSDVVKVGSSEKEHGKCHLVEGSSVDDNKLPLGRKAPKHLLVCFLCNESLQDRVSLEEHLSQHGVSVISSSDKKFVLAAKTPIVVKCNESRDFHPLHRTSDGTKQSGVEKVSENGSGRYESDVSCTSNSLPGRSVSNGTASNEGFRCLVCNISCSKRHLLDQHMKSHTGERPFICPICSKAFSQKSTLTVHQRQHTGEHPYQCEYCPRKFKQRGNYNVHLRGHTGECPFQCSECGKKFKRSRNLNQHLRTHTKEKPFECGICQTKFTTKVALQKHAQMHTSTRKVPQPTFECPVCNAGFTTKGSLNTHARTHSGAHLFSCSECDKKFSTQSALSVHSKTHSGERPFPCQLCSMRFKQKIHLTVHIRTHTGEKPYKCSVCEYRCAQKSLLTTHKKSHSGGHPRVTECTTKRGSLSCPSCPFVCTKSDHMAQHVADCHQEGEEEDRVLSNKGNALIREAELLATEAKDLLETAEASEKRAAKLLNQAKKIKLRAMTIEETARTDALEKLARKKEREPSEEEVYEEENADELFSQGLDSNQEAEPQSCGRL